MQDVFSTLLKIASDIAHEPEGREAIVFAAWRRTSGNLISENAKPLNFENATLKIAVQNKNWQRQLADHSREYLFKVNSMLKEIDVDRIEFVIQPAAFMNIDRTTDTAVGAERIASDSVVKSANAIRDPGLREQFLRAALAAETRDSNK